MTTKHLSSTSRPFMDNDILRHIPSHDGQLFRYLRPWPYETWSRRFLDLLSQGVIEYRGGWVYPGPTPRCAAK